MGNLTINTNSEWLQFISDLKDLSCYLRSEGIEMDANANLVDMAIELLIDWNPKRRESINN